MKEKDWKFKVGDKVLYMKRRPVKIKYRDIINNSPMYHFSFPRTLMGRCCSEGAFSKTNIILWKVLEVYFHVKRVIWEISWNRKENRKMIGQYNRIKKEIKKAVTNNKNYIHTYCYEKNGSIVRHLLEKKIKSDGYKFDINYDTTVGYNIKKKDWLDFTKYIDNDTINVRHNPGYSIKISWN
jgi:hypothetical protein